MTKICREAEASLDYYAMFKNILKQAPLPMSPLESLASSAVRTAHKVRLLLQRPAQRLLVAQRSLVDPGDLQFAPSSQALSPAL